jgi:fatty-acyl-CoA synthase
MHGAGHWVAFSSWHVGATIYLPQVRDRLDPADIWSIVERERIDFLLIIGDAFARPLLDELDRRPYDVSSLTVVLSGGVVLSRSIKDALLERIPGAIILDGLGASESGRMLLNISSGEAGPAGRFASTGPACVLSDALDRELPPGDPEIGWLAKRGRLALGYLGSPELTARTYPIVGGVRHVVPGDRASRLDDGSIEIHGRDAVTINSGGEKIFVEEVESALRNHPGVFDCVVAGRASERWGTEVVAIIEPRPGTVLDPDELKAVAARHLARFKLPKAFVFVDRIQRSPSGKADYRWARSVAQAGGER